MRHALYFELPGDDASAAVAAGGGPITAALRAALGATAPALLKLKHVVESTLPFALDVDARTAAPLAYAIIRGGAEWAQRAVDPISVSPLSPEEEAQWEAGAKSTERGGSTFWTVREGLRGGAAASVPPAPHPLPNPTCSLRRRRRGRASSRSSEMR